MAADGLIVSYDDRHDQWTVRLPDGSAAGSAIVRRRPDGTDRVALVECSPDARDVLLATVARERPVDLLIDIADTEDLSPYQRAGFVAHRREHLYRLPTDPEQTGLGGIDIPSEYDVLRVDQIAEDRLRRFDDLLRQDVPGCAGWQWDATGFHEETFERDDLDPTTYLIAVAPNGQEAGLIRVWKGQPNRRLGLIGTTREHRHRGLARGLLARVCNDLHRRGYSAFTTEADVTNTASNGLLRSIGAERIGGFVELLRATR